MPVKKIVWHFLPLCAMMLFMHRMNKAGFSQLQEQYERNLRFTVFGKERKG